MLSELDLDLLTEELLAKATRLGPRDWQLEATGAGLLRGDRQRLTQAIMNLAHNAVQHTEEGDAIALGSGPRRLAGADLGGATSGRACPSEDRERIFERFAGRGGPA